MNGYFSEMLNYYRPYITGNNSVPYFAIPFHRVFLILLKKFYYKTHMQNTIRVFLKCCQVLQTFSQCKHTLTLHDKRRNKTHIPLVINAYHFYDYLYGC